PPSRVSHQSVDDFLIIAKQRFRHIINEARLVHVPEIMQPTCHIENLIVEGDLGRLRASMWPRKSSPPLLGSPIHGASVRGALLHVPNQTGEDHGNSGGCFALASIVFSSRCDPAY